MCTRVKISSKTKYRRFGSLRRVARDAGMDVIYVHKRDGSIHEDYRTTILGSELLNRGWVLQKWLLSQRLIFFTPTQLFFECQSQWPHNEHNETAHLGLETGQISSKIHSEWRVPLKPLFSYKTKSVGDLWCIVVETFSGLHLAKP